MARRGYQQWGFGFYYLHHWYECPAPAEQGRATLGVISDGPQLHLPIRPSDNIEVVLTMGPKDPAGDPFTAPGVSVYRVESRINTGFEERAGQEPKNGLR